MEHPLFQPTTTVVVAALIAVIIIRISSRGLSAAVKDNQVRYRLRKGIVFISYVAVILVAFGAFGTKITGLGVAVGVAGAGIAFALQEVIASFAGWLAIAFGNFYKSGDRVQLGGITGDVIDVGALRTTLMETGGWVKGDLYNGRIVRVANSFVFKEPVYNYSGEFPFLWDEIVVPIRHGSDPRLAKEILLSAAHNVVATTSGSVQEKWEQLRSTYRLEDAELEPTVTLIVNDNWLEFTLRYVVDYKRRRTTKDRLYMDILGGISGSQGMVELASTTIEITNFNRSQASLS
ncbi:mechanosensitive ion channel [Kamptonema cortianum]|nr:mechanosensitive ion channel [Kamptonema cortianum]